MTASRRLPVWGLLLPFAIGTYLGSLGYLCFPLIPILSLLHGLLLIQWVLLRRGRASALWQDTLILFFIFLCGLAGAHASRPRDPGLTGHGKIVVRGEVGSMPRPAYGHWYFDLDISHVCTGDSLRALQTTVKVRLDSTAQNNIPRSGQILILSGRPAAIHGPRNPGEVNFARILQRRDCWYRLYASAGDIRTMPVPVGRASALRSAAIRKSIYERWVGPPEVIGLLKAICLGDRSTMDSHLREGYARAGGMHLLAVSGLHVGVIWWLLHRLLFLLVRISGREAARCGVILSLLWCYAWLTGFSPSVSRSVCMFSLFSLSGLLDRRGPSLNILLLSMFFLLVVRPVWILETGFQLSYLAVGAILRVHPLVQRAVRTRNPFLRWFRDVASISLAAQLGTLPLVASCFARIPLYGILTSLLTLPLLSVLLGIFVLSLPWLGVDAAAGLFAGVLVFCGSVMNQLVHWVASLPFSVWGPVSMDLFSLPLSLLLIFLLPSMSGKRWRRLLLPALFILSLLMIRNIQLQTALRSKEQVVVAHLRGCTCISIGQGPFLDHYLWCGDAMPRVQLAHYLERAWPRKSYRHHVIRMEAGAETRGSISSVMQLAEGLYLCGNASSRVMVLREAWEEATTAALSVSSPDLLVLSGAPRIRERQAEGSFPAFIPVVADASNPPWYLKNLPGPRGGIHVTGNMGAFILKH